MQEHVALHAFIPEETQNETEAWVAAGGVTAIFEKYYKRIFNYIGYRVHSIHTAEDLTSAVFEKIINKLGTYSEAKAPFEVWLFAIARNVVNDYYRQQKRRQFFPLEMVKELMSSKRDPESLVLREEQNDQLMRALRQLDEREQHVIALKYGANLRNTDIAQITGQSDSNIGVICYRAMKKLKSELGSVDQ